MDNNFASINTIEDINKEESMDKNKVEENETQGTLDKEKEQKEGADFDIAAFEATRAIVSRQAQRLQELKRELKLYASQLKSLLENDAGLAEAEQEAKRLNQRVKTRKAEIMETQEAKSIKLKMMDLKEERSELEDSLSNHLFALYQSTGVLEFEDTQGNIWEYDIKARLKSRKKQ